MSKKNKSSNKTNTKSSGNLKNIKKQLKKDIVIMDKEMIEYVSDSILYTEFTQRIDKWYSNAYVKQMFIHLFQGIKGSVNYENFIAGLIDLNAPCNDLERHILARLLDPHNSGNIFFTNLEFLLWSSYADRDIKEAEKRKQISSSSETKSKKERNILNATDLSSDTKIYTCGTIEARWLHVYIKMIKFDRFPEHPGNFVMDFLDNINFGVVSMYIKKTLNFPTTSFQLYSSATGAPEHKLNHNLNFQDLGIFGGPKLAPTDINLYYDFNIGYMDDSIIFDLEF